MYCSTATSLILSHRNGNAILIGDTWERGFDHVCRYTLALVGNLLQRQSTFISFHKIYIDSRDVITPVHFAVSDTRFYLIL